MYRSVNLAFPNIPPGHQWTISDEGQERGKIMAKIGNGSHVFLASSPNQEVPRDIKVRAPIFQNCAYKCAQPTHFMCNCYVTTSMFVELK